MEVGKGKQNVNVYLKLGETILEQVVKSYYLESITWENNVRLTEIR